MDFWTNCPERYWQKGFKQPKDNGMPERSWGSYLPGDEPGWMCAVENDGCTDIAEDCPLFVEKHKGIYYREDLDLYYNAFNGRFWRKR